MKNQGISLISLIITIIVIIILAAIVIFTGLGTPDSAQFSAFTNDVDSVYMAVTDAFANLKVSHAASGDYRTNEQIYIEVATGTDPDQYGVMSASRAVNKGTAANGIVATDSDLCQNIIPGTNKTGMGSKLPEVRQSNKAWYVTKDGRVFNANGFVYDNKTYFNASYYADSKLTATDDTYGSETTKTSRAYKIANQMLNGSGLVVTP